MGFPSGSVGKEPACNARDAGGMGSILGSGRSPGGGHSNPLQYSCLEIPMDRGAWEATVHRCKELDTTEATEHSTAAQCPLSKLQQIFTFHCKVCGKQNLSMYVFTY